MKRIEIRITEKQIALARAATYQQLLERLKQMAEDACKRLSSLQQPTSQDQSRT